MVLVNFISIKERVWVNNYNTIMIPKYLIELNPRMTAWFYHENPFTSAIVNFISGDYSIPAKISTKRNIWFIIWENIVVHNVRPATVNN